jgi:RNA polymerase sigma-70 factor (ECF subfamily)
MMDALCDPLERLIADLSSADVQAAQAALDQYEPFLRMVVRKQLGRALRSKFDSLDVVQSIWADLLTAAAREDWRFRDPTQLRAFLARVARNRLIDQRRMHRQAMERVRSMESLSPVDEPRASNPRASEVVRGRELWDHLLASCRPAHRRVLRLRLEGRSLAEIAERCALHEGSVRRILYRLAKTLRLPVARATSAA